MGTFLGMMQTRHITEKINKKKIYSLSKSNRTHFFIDVIDHN